MVELVWANTKKIDFEVINQIQFGLLTFFGGTTAVQDKNLTSPNLIIPFVYNLLILVVEKAYMVCPTTSIAKILKFRMSIARYV